MRKRPSSTPADLPDTRSELHRWVRDHLGLAPAQEQALADAVDHFLAQHEQRWQESKQDAVRAISAGFTERLTRLREELSARDATVSSIAHYFENLVADLTDRVHRDPKTRLMNFRRFVEQLEAFLALDQRGRWCAVGVVDITAFKWYNDTLGHQLGDRIIDRIARLLREQVRAGDLIAQEPHEAEQTPAAAREAGEPAPGQELHARFGGDEFCFLIPRLDEPRDATVIAERFREAVERFDWSAEDARLVRQPVNVDVGVVSLRLGSVRERRPIGRQLARDLLARADRLMYDAKGERADRVHEVRVVIEDGRLRELAAREA